MKLTASKMHDLIDYSPYIVKLMIILKKNLMPCRLTRARPTATFLGQSPAAPVGSGLAVGCCKKVVTFCLSVMYAVKTMTQSTR